jgi:hypothetical protein
MAYAEQMRMEAERAAAAAEAAEATRLEEAELRVELGEEPLEEEGAAEGPLSANVWTVAQWDYEPQADDELRFGAEAYVWLTGGDGCDGTEGWARGCVLEPHSGFRGKEGVLPIMYVRKVTEEELLAAGLRRLGPLERPAAPRPPARKQNMRVSLKGGGKGEMKEEEEAEEQVDDSAPLPAGWKLRGLKGSGKSGRWYEHDSGLVQHIRPKAKVVIVHKDDSNSE